MKWRLFWLSFASCLRSHSLAMSLTIISKNLMCISLLKMRIGAMSSSIKRKKRMKKRKITKANLLVLDILNPTLEARYQWVMAARAKTLVKSHKIRQKTKAISRNSTPSSQNTKLPTKIAKSPTQPKSTTADQLQTIPTKVIFPMNHNTRDSKPATVTKADHKQNQMRANPQKPTIICKFLWTNLLPLMILSKKEPSRSVIPMKSHPLAIFHKPKRNFPSHKSTEAITTLHLPFLLQPMTLQKTSLLHSRMPTAPSPVITKATMLKFLIITQCNPAPKTIPSWISSETCSNQASMKATTAKKTFLVPQKNIFNKQKRYYKRNNSSKNRILRIFTRTSSRKLTN